MKTNEFFKAIKGNVVDETKSANLSHFHITLDLGQRASDIRAHRR